VVKRSPGEYQSHIENVRPVMEGIMTKQSSISLIAGAVLCGVAVLSIAAALSGRIAFDDQPDAMVAQLYTSHFGADDQQQAMLSGPAASAGQAISH
jgi:hypothetical protein